MDGSQFDRLARAFATLHTRRGAAAILAAAGSLPLLGFEYAEGKKKKKKCKSPKVKCGTKCLPAGSCCTDANCGGNGVCQGNTCACFTGFRPCNGSCILKDNCCGNADCGGGVCSGGQCRCLAGTRACNGKCIPESGCCTNEECGSPCRTCQNNVCSAGCGAGETCLANGSCGKTCTVSGTCNAASTCSCNVNHGDDVCRITVGTPECNAATPNCTTTADCPAGKVCSSICGGPDRCLALCPS